jgi:phosphatidylinositol glycan class B
VYTISVSQKKTLFWACFFVVVSLSVQKHKEFRFLMPIVAPLMIYAGKGISLISKLDKRKNRSGWKSYTFRLILLLGCTNICIGTYFSRIHKKGVIDVIHWLRNQVYAGRVNDVLFLMPCHSTPFYSHIHKNIPMQYISCEPPLK